MWSTLKAIPVLPKIILGSLLLLVVFGLSHRRHYNATSYNFEPSTSTVSAAERPSAYRSQSARSSAAYEQSSEADATQSQLAQFQAEHADLSAKAQQCMAASDQARNQMNMAMMQGQGMINNQPSCLQNMPQWFQRITFLEAAIYQLQTGDRTTSVRGIVGIPEAQSGGSEASYYRPSSPSNDGGIGAVERWDREANRETSLYNEPDGTEHELPTAPYYYRNPNSGQILPSNSPNPPNDGRYWDPMTPQE